MNGDLPNIDPSRVIRLEIAPTGAIWRDTKKNRKWIFVMLAAIFIVLFLSAQVATQIGHGFMVAEGNPVHGVSTLSYPTAIYFTVINMTTVGFGDIFPVTRAARALAIFNAIFGLITFAALVSIIMMAFAPSSEPEPGQPAATKDPADAGAAAAQGAIESLLIRRAANDRVRERIAAIRAEAEAIVPVSDQPADRLDAARAQAETLRKGLEDLDHEALWVAKVSSSYERTLRLVLEDPARPKQNRSKL